MALSNASSNPTNECRRKKEKDFVLIFMLLDVNRERS
jgi:hypothetical protein